MLGSATEAEDIVQEAWLRWQGTTARSCANRPRSWPRRRRGWRSTTLQSARARRETYIGPWLPEPVDTSADPLLGAGARRGAGVRRADAAGEALADRARDLRAARGVRLLLRRDRERAGAERGQRAPARGRARKQLEGGRRREGRRGRAPAPAGRDRRGRAGRRPRGARAAVRRRRGHLRGRRRRRERGAQADRRARAGGEGAGRARDASSGRASRSSRSTPTGSRRCSCTAKASRSSWRRSPLPRRAWSRSSSSPIPRNCFVTP